MSKYREFNIGDLVQIEHGNRPLGIINGGLESLYGNTFRTYTKYEVDQNGYLNYDSPIVVQEPYAQGVNYLVYPVLISDVEETRIFEKWYWPGGLTDYHGVRKSYDPLRPRIHPSYLTFLAGA